MLIIVISSVQYQNNLLPATSSIECQDGKQNYSLAKTLSSMF